MSDHRPRFDPEELRDAAAPRLTDAELAAALAAARALEAVTVRDQVVPSEGFEDRIMAAIAEEAPPKAVVRPAATLVGRPAAFLGSVRDAWGVAVSGGRPVMVRAQALSFVLLVGLATGSVTAVAAIGAASLFDGPTPTPSIQPAPSPTVAPSPASDPPPSPTPTPSPSESADPSAEPTESAEPGETPGAGSGEPDHSAEPTKTAKPTKTPRPSATPDDTDEPDESEEPDETDEPDESETPEP